VNAQALTYPQNSEGVNVDTVGVYRHPGMLRFAGQVIDLIVFSRNASNLIDWPAGRREQRFGGAISIFPTKLSTGYVGDFKKLYGS
jgi:hypothetical protein